MSAAGRIVRTGSAVVAAVFIAAACGGGPAMRAGRTSGKASGPFPASTPPPISPLPPSGSELATPEPPQAPPSPEHPPAAEFHGSSRRIDDATKAGMTSWHRGCPVPVEELRLLTIDHWGFDGAVRSGQMIVNRSVVTDVLIVFHALFDARFPIQRMKPVDEYGADDDRSMAANNTSAFNCRSVTGGSSWSQHSYGWAIDINPVQNPYVGSGGTILPPAGERYADRTVHAKGMVHAGDEVVSAFTAVGWGWGGSWDSFQDYQHFSATGR